MIPSPGPRKASLDQVLHYFRSQKPQLAGPQGRRIREACGHMRRPWKRDGPSTFPARRNASSPKNCERTSRVRMCARLPRVFGLSHFLGPIQIFQSENLFASLFNPKTSLPGQLGRRRTDFRRKMVSRMTPKAHPELPRCALESAAGGSVRPVWTQTHPHNEILHFPIIKPPILDTKFNIWCPPVVPSPRPP